MKNHNREQDISITELKTEVKNLKERLDGFIDNEFEHLRQKVDWILWFLILGTLITISINMIFK